MAVWLIRAGSHEESEMKLIEKNERNAAWGDFAKALTGFVHSYVGIFEGPWRGPIPRKRCALPTRRHPLLVQLGA